MLWPIQRRDRRYHIAAPVRIQGVDRSGKAFDLEAWTLDVSSSGACIHLPPDLDLPRRFHVVAENYQFRADADVELVWERQEPLRRAGVCVSPASPQTTWVVR